MAVSKVILNGNTLIDTTDKTVEAGSMLSGITALKNDGTTATGTIQSRTASDLTASGATVTVPAGNYASQATKSVATGTEGTPTATKGAVSNHSVTVTPSVTNTAGYISGGTKTGTGVSVNVTELESGTKSITANGTGISVSGYSAVDVAVPSSSPTLITKSITANGTYNAQDDSADGYSSVTVNVSGGGGSGLVYETGTYTPASDISATNVSINFTNTHSNRPVFAMIVDSSGEYDNTLNTQYFWMMGNILDFAGNPIYSSTTTRYYAQGYNRARASSTTGTTGNSINPTSDGEISNYLTTNNFKPFYTGTYYYRAGKTYKWIAAWAPTT